MKNFLKILPYILTFVLALIFFKQCMSPRTETTETIDYEQIVDSLQALVKIPEPEIVKIKVDSIVYKKSKVTTIKGKDSIIYETDTVYLEKEVKKYNRELISKDSLTHVNLSIYTTGTLFKVDGTISYQKETKTVKTTQYLNENATYLYLETSLMPLVKKFEVGVDRTINNKFMFGGSVEYIPEHKLGFVNAKLGFDISRKK